MNAQEGQNGGRVNAPHPRDLNISYVRAKDNDNFFLFSKFPAETLLEWHTFASPFFCVPISLILLTSVLLWLLPIFPPRRIPISETGARNVCSRIYTPCDTLVCLLATKNTHAIRTLKAPWFQLKSVGRSGGSRESLLVMRVFQCPGSGARRFSHESRSVSEQYSSKDACSHLEYNMRLFGGTTR